MSKLSRSCAARESEPWLLAISLKSKKDIAKNVRRLYATRMQIEKSFIVTWSSKFRQPS